MSGATAPGDADRSARWSDTTRRAGELLGGLAAPDVMLGGFCTYRVGGPAAFLVEVTHDTELDQVAAVVAETGVDTLVVGRGSNLLVADRGFDGLAIVLGSSFARIDIPSGIDGDTEGEKEVESRPEPRPEPRPEVEGDDLVIVGLGGAALLPVAARATARANLTGFEWAVGVPGSVGGAVRMNAGGHGSDMAQSLVRAEVIDLATGKRAWWSVDDLGLAYRHSSIGARHLVTRAEIGLRRGDGRGETRLSEIVRWRREHQPGGANAGSVFANPPGDSAGRLIDAAGLKGHRVGTAAVSTKHANFIQADADGSADDVARLIADLIVRIEDRYGIRLQPENRLIGFRASPSAEGAGAKVGDG